MTDKSATERLRELLDERGVEWESKDIEGISGFHDTRWNTYGVRWCYTEFVGNNYTKLIPSKEFHCTPEQAIAATLGGGDKSRWHELFGTSERAAKTLSIMQRCELGIIGNCDECEIHDACRVRDGDYDALLEWLKGDM